jgi:hypothetical protein
MSDHSSKTILIDAELYAKIQEMADGDRSQVSRIISDSLSLFTNLSFYARTQLRQIAVERPADLPRVYRSVSATVTHAVHTAPDTAWTPKR